MKVLMIAALIFTGAKNLHLENIRFSTLKLEQMPGQTSQEPGLSV